MDSFEFSTHIMLFSMNKDSFTSRFSVCMLLWLSFLTALTGSIRTKLNIINKTSMTSLACYQWGVEGMWIFSLSPLDRPFSVKVLLMTFIRLSSTLFPVFWLVLFVFVVVVVLSLMDVRFCQILFLHRLRWASGFDFLSTTWYITLMTSWTLK